MEAVAEWRNECILHSGQTSALNTGTYFSACPILFHVNVPSPLPSNLLGCLSWADTQAEQLGCPVLPVTANIFVILHIPLIKTHSWLIVSTVIPSFMSPSFGWAHYISPKLVTVLTILMFLLSYLLNDRQLFWACSFISVLLSVMVLETLK